MRQVPKWANSDMLDIQDKRYWRWRLGRFKTDSVQGRFWWEEVRGDFIEVQVIFIKYADSHTHANEWYVEHILGLKLELILQNNMIFNLWLLKLVSFVSQNFLTRMQKNKPFFFYFLFYFSVLLVPSLVTTPCCLAGKLIASAPSSVHWSTGTLGSCFMSNTDWPTSFPRDISLSSAWLCCMQLGLWMWSAAELTSLLLPMHVEAYALTG